jgi:hypothetical protein
MRNKLFKPNFTLEDVEGWLERSQINEISLDDLLGGGGAVNVIVERLLKEIKELKKHEKDTTK